MSEIVDLVVVGGGSGGIATARRAAEYGARVVLVEAGRLGGTCVNVGCVPKKLMWNAAELAGAVDDARGYGFDVALRNHDWPGLKAKRDAYIARLNDIYESNLAKSKVELLRGRAQVVAAHTVEVGGRRIDAERIVLATGGRPRWPASPVPNWALIPTASSHSGSVPCVSPWWVRVTWPSNWLACSLRWAAR
jgi:glutathione reductase (NADPH)